MIDLHQAKSSFSLVLKFVVTLSLIASVTKSKTQLSLLRNLGTHCLRYSLLFLIKSSYLLSMDSFNYFRPMCSFV
jgi:hypothetical protein